MPAYEAAEEKILGLLNLSFEGAVLKGRAGSHDQPDLNMLFSVLYNCGEASLNLWESKVCG